MSNALRDPVLRLFLVTGAICLLISIVLAAAVSGNNALVRFDKRAALTLHEHTSEPFNEFFETFTDLGPVSVWAIGLTMGARLLLQKRWTLLGIGLAAVGGGEIVNTLLKDIFARQRPVFPHAEITPAQYSFPSGHAMMTLIAYGFLVYLLWPALRTRRARIALVAALAALMLLIGFSRLYLGVHYVSDVAAGYTIGGTWLLLWLSVLRVVETERRV